MIDNELKLKESLMQDTLSNCTKKRDYKKILKRVAIGAGIAVSAIAIYAIYRYCKNKSGDSSNDGTRLGFIFNEATDAWYKYQNDIMDSVIEVDDDIIDPVFTIDYDMSISSLKDTIVDEDDELLNSIWCSDIDSWDDFSKSSRDGYY